jgi:putative acetyltransferase
MSRTIREERPIDAEQIRTVNLAAFETSTEADLVDALRRDAGPIISLVAEEDTNIVGHILFSPATLVGQPKLTLMGLAPMAVVPARQRQGIGSRLVVEGLERCRRAKVAAVVVLGHAEYYPRFGFIPASRLSLRCEYDVPENVFMVRELHDGALTGLWGTIRYHPVFANF